jgi:exopolyphosphatase/guanosine-5'-triphosphate,3'-diphosphate pyrophosphatase
MPQQQTYLTPDLVPRMAAIDIGSNSIRLVVAEALQGGRYRILDEERESTRLGRCLASTGRLDEPSIHASLAALRRFQSIAEGLGVEQLRTIATCAVREAKNGADFCAQVKDQLQLTIEVISADKEAQLAFHSVRNRIDLTGKNTLLADIGGGSTEMVLASGEMIEAIYTTPLGAVRLSETFSKGQEPGNGRAMASEDYRRLRKSIDRCLRKFTTKPVTPIHLLIGSGGTFTNLASMVMAKKKQSQLPTTGYQVSRAEVRHLVDRLRKMSAKHRHEVPGLNPDRADIIVPGLMIIDRILKRFQVNVLQVHAYGVRDGLLMSMIENMQGTDGAGPLSSVEAIERFASACHVELEHARHAALLTRHIYQGIAKRFDLPKEDLHLLEAAARLQDVGYLISYQGHHKHSYHLILHSRLETFRPHELALIANVARYHRGAEPKNKHVHFRRLNAFDQQRVRRLAAILRIADGLDRSQNQSVQSVHVECSKKRVELQVAATVYPEVNLWAARQRTELFEKTFGVDVHVQWDGEALGASC